MHSLTPVPHFYDDMRRQKLDTPEDNVVLFT